MNAYFKELKIIEMELGNETIYQIELENNLGTKRVIYQCKDLKEITTPELK